MITAEDKQKITVELGQVMSFVLQKNFEGKTVPMGDVLNITISALGPIIADILQSLGDKEAEDVIDVIRQSYGRHLVECINRYLGR